MPYDAGPPVAAMLLAAMTIDHLVDAAHNPILLLAIGGLSGITGTLTRSASPAVEQVHLAEVPANSLQ